jgi:hypothetical protein
MSIPVSKQTLYVLPFAISYAVESFGLSCTLDWRAIPWTYTVSIFAFCYVVPLLLLVLCYGKIVLHVRKASASLVSSHLDVHVARVSGLIASRLCMHSLSHYKVYFVSSTETNG